MKYDDLIVWQKSMKLAEKIYQLSSLFPREERYELISQLRRSAVSIPSNIAEGQGLKSTKSYINHVSIAFGSLMELETQLKISHKLSFLTQEHLSTCLKETEIIGKMPSRLRSSLKQYLAKKTKIPQSSIHNPQSI